MRRSSFLVFVSLFDADMGGWKKEADLYIRSMLLVLPDSTSSSVLGSCKSSWSLLVLVTAGVFPETSSAGCWGSLNMALSEDIVQG